MDNDNYHNNHAMAWVGFGLSLAFLFLAFFIDIPPLLFILIGIICAIFSLADIVKYGASVPAIIGIIITIILLVLGCYMWYYNAWLINQMNQFDPLDQLGY